jgi:glycine cleavage system H protein
MDGAMSNLKYTKDHEWLRVEGDVATVGITEYAQEQLGDVVFVELPEEGRQLTVGEEAAVIESVKAAGEIKAPLPGTVVEINQALEDTPDLVNQDAQGDGWFFKIRVEGDVDESDFLDQDVYNNLI